EHKTLSISWSHYRSERRFHLGGYVGAALFSLYESKGWLTRHLGYREVTITEKGYAAFKTHFHI
ncbi:TPA: hypothetical protein ACRUZI_005080, partial [Escherichia coli]|nr:hypothetical protein [Escherichia coli]